MSARADTAAARMPAAALSDRALGWLRFIWDKATTPDDWSDQGEPHPWWDRYTAPPMCSFPRFDLHYMSYVLPVMLEATPAWREAYTRIADELIRRCTSFWGAVDWCTLIGPDPGVDRYPPEWLAFIPEPLRGRYAPPGWTANGVEPWGLQPDPVGADGNVFYRGWLNLLLGTRRYVSDAASEPRGQVNAMMMLAECASPGAWWRVFNEPKVALASEPTLRDVDYPSIGIRRARNDMTQHVLTIETTAATPSRRGDPTGFTIDQLPSLHPARPGHRRQPDPCRLPRRQFRRQLRQFRQQFPAKLPRMKGAAMTPASALAVPLIELLRLAHPPVAITFSTQPATSGGGGVAAQPAGCCFWEPAQGQCLDTRAADHANCSTGSYTHGLIDLATAASRPDTVALISSGWITAAELTAVARLPIRPLSIRYEPLTIAISPDVVLVRLSPFSLMTLQGACSHLQLVTRPQCQIVPLAYSGQIAVSPGCAISRARTGLPAGEMTCALPAAKLPAIIDDLRQAVTADQAAVAYAARDILRKDLAHE